MNALVRAFYSMALWFSSFQLEIAKSAPIQNRENIKALRHDVREFEGVLDRVDLGLMTDEAAAADRAVLIAAVILGLFAGLLP